MIDNMRRLMVSTRVSQIEAFSNNLEDLMQMKVLIRRISLQLHDLGLGEMRRMKGLVLILVGLFFLLSACNNGDYIMVSLSDAEMPPSCADVVIQPLDEITRYEKKKEQRFEIVNNSDREIDFDNNKSPIGISWSLLKKEGGIWTCQRPVRIATASFGSVGSALSPGESKVLSVFPYHTVGRLGKGVYRFYCFYTFNDEPDQVYSSFYEFEL